MGIYVYKKSPRGNMNDHEWFMNGIDVQLAVLCQESYEMMCHPSWTASRVKNKKTLRLGKRRTKH